MFRETSSHSIDPKGRLIVPSRFRDVISRSGGDRVMLSMMDHGLFGYTHDQWRIVEEKILKMSSVSDRMRRFRRLFVGGAAECTIDKQNRILIPPILREYAGLKKEIVLIGVLDHFEIFSRDAWEKEHIQKEEDLGIEDFRNEIAELGL